MQVTFDPTNPQDLAIVVGMLASSGAIQLMPPNNAVPPAPAPEAKPAKAKAEKAAAPAPVPATAAEAAERTFGQHAEPKTTAVSMTAETVPQTIAGTSAATPAPAPAPAAAGETAQAEPVTLDQARKALIAVGDKLGPKLGAEAARAEVVKLLGEVGAQTIKDVKPDGYAKLVTRAREVLAQHEAA